MRQGRVLPLWRMRCGIWQIKSGEAAKNTTSLIEESLRSIDNGQKIANETAQSLGQVVTSAQQIAEAVEDISKASTEQAKSLDQVRIGIEQISGVVQTNAAMVERTLQQEASFQRKLRNFLI